MRVIVPKISVVMPACNAEATIANAINSILNQSMKDWELIIVNDGSMDNTKEIVDKFKDERIHYVELPHSGIVKARNYGNYLARADIIAIQDADDLSMPDRLEKSYEQIHKHNVDVLYHGIYVNMWDKKYNCIFREYRPAKPFNKYDLLKGQYISGVPVFRRKCWLAKPFREETQFAYDWMMLLDWAFSGFTFRAYDVGLYEYVRQENSASQTFERTGQRKQSMDEIKRIMKEEYNA